MFWNHFPVLRLGPLDIDTAAVPELRALAGVPQPDKHHPERDCAVHVFMAVHQARLLTEEPAARFAVLLHDLGKGTTPAEILPQHIDHEERGVPLVHAVCDRLGAPQAWRDLAALVCEHHTRCHRAIEMSPTGKRRLLRRVGAADEPERF
jgi:tRNA nucleotidyltransferase (CCA-adding enzyme)